MDFRLSQAQSVVFLSAIDRSKITIATSVTKAIPDLAEVDPIILPIPDDAPPEVPRIIIQNELKGRGFHFSPSRIDLFMSFSNSPPASQLAELCKPLEQDTGTLWASLQSTASARGHRLAFVATFAAETDNAASVLSTEFIRPVHARDAAEAQVHFLHKMTLGTHNVNRWARLHSLETKPGTLNLLVDVNTVAENVFDVTRDELSVFLGGAVRIIQETVATLTGARP
jgi:hypothetical protein